MQFTKLFKITWISFSLIFSEVTILDFLVIWWSIHRCLSVLCNVQYNSLEKVMSGCFCQKFFSNFFSWKKKVQTKIVIFWPKKDWETHFTLSQDHKRFAYCLAFYVFVQSIFTTFLLLHTLHGIYMLTIHWILVYYCNLNKDKSVVVLNKAGFTESLKIRDRRRLWGKLGEI